MEAQEEELDALLAIYGEEDCHIDAEQRICEVCGPGVQADGL
jgi:hypothetical protein